MLRPTWSRKWILIAALPTAFLLGGAAFVLLIFIRAQHSLERAGVALAQEGRYSAKLEPLAPVENAGFEAIASPARYVSGAMYQGKLYVSGPAGLYVFGSGEGFGDSLLKSYRVGLDLPAAPLGALAVGRLRGAAEPELLIATSGAGVLIFSGGHTGDGSGSLRQLLPADADARSVTALLPLATGELLVGTARRGLLVWRGGDVEEAKGGALESFSQATVGLAVTALAADGSGFWVGTRNQGLRHCHGGQVDSFETAEGQTGLPDNRIDAIAVRGDRVFAGTPLGVAEFDGGRPARVLARNLFANAIFADASGLAVGTLDEGIRRVALDAGRRPGVSTGPNDRLAMTDETPEPAEQFVPMPEEGDSAAPLLAVMRDGVRREQAGGGWAPLISDSEPAKTAKLTDGNISALAFDVDGRLWVGFFDRGLDILAASGDAMIHREDDRLFCVNRIVLDPRRGTMAVATANGLVLFDRGGKPRQVLTHKDGLIADHVNDVAFSGDSLVAATPAGVTFVDAAGARSLYAFEGLVNNHVYALGARPGGDVLAGTLGGVSMLQHEAVVRNLTTSNSALKHNWVTAIVPLNVDAHSEWLVGTYGAGVMRMDGEGRLSAMDGVTKPMVVNPNAMLVTSAHVFAGTLSDGLWVCSRSTGRWRQVVGGLPSLNVTALAERNGEVYVGTENGLVRIAESRLD